jgi:hypothetical protein
MWDAQHHASKQTNAFYEWFIENQSNLTLENGHYVITQAQLQSFYDSCVASLSNRDQLHDDNYWQDLEDTKNNLADILTAIDNDTDTGKYYYLGDTSIIQTTPTDHEQSI